MRFSFIFSTTLFSAMTIFFMGSFSLASERFSCSRHDQSYDIAFAGDDLVVTRGGETCVLTEDKAFQKEEIRTFQVKGVYDEVPGIAAYDLPDLVSSEGYLLYEEKKNVNAEAVCSRILGREEAFIHLYVWEQMKGEQKADSQKSVIGTFRSPKGYPILFLNRCTVK